MSRSSTWGRPARKFAFTPTLILFSLSCLYASAQISVPAQGSNIDKASLGSYLRHLQLIVPDAVMDISDGVPSSKIPGFFEVKVQVSYKGDLSSDLYYVSGDTSTILTASVYDIQRNPFDTIEAKLASPAQPSFGSPNALVRIVIFADFQCPFCREEARSLRSDVASAFPKDVRVTFEDFPLAKHEWARPAAVAGRCVYGQSESAFWDFFDWVYDHQDEFKTENLSMQVHEFSNHHQLDVPALDRCLASAAPDQEVAGSIKRGQALGVAATPTMFVNGRKIDGSLPSGVLLDVVRAEIEFQRAVGASKIDSGPVYPQ